MTYAINVVRTARQHTAVIKTAATLATVGDIVGASIGKVSATLEKKKLEPIGAPFCRTLEFKDGNMKLEIGFPIAKPLGANEGDVQPSELAESEVATTKHVGSQDESVKAYEAIHAWAQKNGRNPGGAPWEVYASETAMEIFFPLST